MHTVFSAEDDALTKGIALHVRLLDRWQGDGAAEVVGTRLVYNDGESEWLAPSRLAMFEDWFRSLQVYRLFSLRPTFKCCIVLRDVAKAVPRFALTDERCPVLAIIRALEDKGWVGDNRIVCHTDQTLTYDGRHCNRMRFYYTVLLFALKVCLPLSSGRIPFMEPGAYYRLLLKGVSVDAGLPATEYVALLNAKRINKTPLTLKDFGDDPPEPDALDDVHADGVILADEEGHQSKKRKVGGGGPSRGAASSRPTAEASGAPSSSGILRGAGATKK